MRRLARFCYHHRRLVLGTWVLVLAGLLVLANLFGGVFKVDFALPGSESQRAIDILEANGFGSRAGEQAQVVFEAQQGVDDAVAAGLRDRLAALDRALQRVENGSYGRSTRSGLPIPDERLEADPAAELTVQEAAASQAANR